MEKVTEGKKEVRKVGGRKDKEGNEEGKEGKQKKRRKGAR